MAGVLMHANSGEQAIGNGKTLLQAVAAPNHRVKISGFGISIKGVVTTDIPILVELVRHDSAGTMTPGTLEPSVNTHLSKKNSADPEVLQTSVRINATVEPTNVTAILERFEVHPQTGTYKYLPFGQEHIIPGGGRVSIKVTSATLTYSAVAEMDLEE